MQFSLSFPWTVKGAKQSHFFGHMLACTWTALWRARAYGCMPVVLLGHLDYPWNRKGELHIQTKKTRKEHTTLQIQRFMCKTVTNILKMCWKIKYFWFRCEAKIISLEIINTLPNYGEHEIIASSKLWRFKLWRASNYSENEIMAWNSPKRHNMMSL